MNKKNFFLIIFISILVLTTIQAKTDLEFDSLKQALQEQIDAKGEIPDFDLTTRANEIIKSYSFNERIKYYFQNIIVARNSSNKLYRFLYFALMGLISAGFLWCLGLLGKGLLNKTIRFNIKSKNHIALNKANITKNKTIDTFFTNHIDFIAGKLWKVFSFSIVFGLLMLIPLVKEIINTLTLIGFYSMTYSLIGKGLFWAQTITLTTIYGIIPQILITLFKYLDIRRKHQDEIKDWNKKRQTEEFLKGINEGMKDVTQSIYNHKVKKDPLNPNSGKTDDEIIRGEFNQIKKEFEEN